MTQVFFEEKFDESVEKINLDFDYLDFGSLSEEEIEILEIKETNGPGELVISLLEYAAPLLGIRSKLCNNKLNMLHPSDNCKKTGIFKIVNFFANIKSINQQIPFATLSGKGNTTSDKQAKYIITETVDSFDPTKIYIQPQQIFDCINRSKILPFYSHSVGNELPVRT